MTDNETVRAYLERDLLQNVVLNSPLQYCQNFNVFVCISGVPLAVDAH